MTFLMTGSLLGIFPVVLYTSLAWAIISVVFDLIKLRHNEKLTCERSESECSAKLDDKGFAA
jgi:uncharacterized membrane-anchored protein YitT (DUF2179 family)